jgi:hypothetical protein
MDKTQYKYETIGMQMIFSEDEIESSQLDAISNQFTKALAESMRNTKDTIMGEILSGNVEKHQIEVDFDD